MKLKYYLHNDCNESEMEEFLISENKSLGNLSSVTKLKTMAHQLLGHFYEIGFDVELDDNTGKILSVKLMEDKK